MRIEVRRPDMKNDDLRDRLRGGSRQNYPVPPEYRDPPEAEFHTAL